MSIEPTMLRRRLFWIVLIALSVLSAVFTFRNFSTAFPLVSIDLQMDRADALRSAQLMAMKYAWPPAGSRQAAEFGGDQEVQNFIELEGGGKAALSRVLKEKLFVLYLWRVRLFKEGETHETLVRFTPEGQPYGFHVKLPDKENGPNIAAAEAQAVAEKSAREEWAVDFGKYQLVESSKDDKPGGRTDHTFVYERQDERLGEGRYRLRLVVGGDRLTELTRFVKVPEAFTRRYEQMRASNDVIGAADQVVVFALYLLGFCGIGLFFMMRQHWVLWRQPMVWGILIGGLMGLQELNSWPLLWMNYDTALPASGFAIRQIARAVALFGVFSVLMIVSFMAAETLSRRAFPHHVQLWKEWSRPGSASKFLLGKTFTGYLLVAPFFAYEIVLYFFAQGKLGWWTPSDTLLNPDMFANYVPSLSAVAQALQAGFWEESLFRAVPLAVAALIGDRFGRRKTFIGGAMILQALVFASGHAGYVNQPAYARVVELIIPSFAFGTLYLLFGLVPGIVLHFTYDAAWMALPLFVSPGTRAHIEQAIVILAVLVPLWVVLLNRIRLGVWVDVPEEALNAAWKPRDVEPATSEPAAAAEPVAMPAAISPAVRRWLPILGVAGLATWIVSTPFKIDAGRMSSTRSIAESDAKRFLKDQNIQIDSSWTVLSRTEGQAGEDDRFVWQKAGREHYEKLLASKYLGPPRWVVRFARFHGDVADRAEEYQVSIGESGNDNPDILRMRHSLPEGRAGKSLTVDEARAIAAARLNREGDVTAFKEISAEASKRPQRTDWTFTFKDTRDYGLPEGEPRISIEIAGDEVIDVARFVYVPEEWLRNERSRQNLPRIFGTICTVGIVGIVLGGSIIGVIHWSRRRPFSARTFFTLFVLLFALSVINVLNSLPAIESQFTTAQPLGLQIGIVIAVSIVFAVFTAVAIAMAGGLVGAITKPSSLSLGTSLVAGTSLGFFLAGAGALARHAIPSTGPLWGSLGAASAYVPVVSAALSPLSGFFIQALILLTVFCFVGTRPRAAALLILVGLALAGSSIETIPSWLIVGTITGVMLMIAYLMVFRHEPTLLIITVATLAILSIARDVLQFAFPPATLGSIAGIIILAAACILWLRSTQGTMIRPAHRAASAEGKSE